MEVAKKQHQKGLASMVAKALGCHPEYSRRVLRGGCPVKSELSQKIINKAKQLEAIIKN